MKKSTLLLLLAVPLLFAASEKKPKDFLLETLQGELMRNFKVLKKEASPIHYMSYRVVEEDGYYVLAALGDVQFENSTKKRSADIELRAGTHKTDNMHELKGQWKEFGLPTVSLPVENDKAAIKNALWRFTDEARKQAQDMLAEVKANIATSSAALDKSDDFAPLKTPVYIYEPTPPLDADKAAIKAQVQKYSELMKGYDFIFDSGVRFEVSNDSINFVNTEGSMIKQPRTLARLSYQIVSRNEDGMVLERFKAYDGFSAADMPGEETVVADIKADIELLNKLRNAPLAEPYSGPAIIMNEAAGVMFHEILGHRLEGDLQKVEGFGNTFTDKVGVEIVSPIISVYDDPMLKSFKSVNLRGHYLADDEGVRAQKITLIENGVLKGFMMNRTPVNNFPSSTGNGRKAPGLRPSARMSNTIVSASDAVSFENLRALLIEEIKKQNKPYGLIFSEVAGGQTSPVGNQSINVFPRVVYKVYADGRPDELIRGADIVGTPITSFNKILAAADDDGIFNGDCGSRSGWVPVSAIAPSMLFGEIEIQRSMPTPQKLPILKPAHAEAAQ